MKRNVIALMLLVPSMIGAQTASAYEDEQMVVRTESGLVKGFDHEGAIGFLGIPYAKVERFMPPQPVDKWDTIRVCDHWWPQMMQQTWGKQLSEDEMSEKNSCVLNVWTTDTKESKPVMLWLHGGGFDSGTSAWDPGMKLAQKDVVVVSVNHRLNILGFLDLSARSEKYKYSGNVGMFDVVQGLQWIHKNIRQFGGDLARSNLADILRKGSQGYPKDLGRTFKLYSECGLPYAHYRCGEFLEKGWGTEKDLDKAKTYYMLAYKEGHPLAKKKRKEWDFME